MSLQTTPSKKPDATMTLYRCAQCFLIGKPDDMKPAAAFGVAAPHEITSKILADGAWTRCLSCREDANLARRRAGLPDSHAGYACLMEGRINKREFPPVLPTQQQSMSKDEAKEVFG